MKHSIKVGDVFYLNDLEDADEFRVEDVHNLLVRLSCNGNNCGWWDQSILKNKKKLGTTLNLDKLKRK